MLFEEENTSVFCLFCLFGQFCQIQIGRAPYMHEDYMLKFSPLVHAIMSALT